MQGTETSSLFLLWVGGNSSVGSKCSRYSSLSHRILVEGAGVSLNLSYRLVARDRLDLVNGASGLGKAADSTPYANHVAGIRKGQLRESRFSCGSRSFGRSRMACR